MRRARALFFRRQLQPMRRERDAIADTADALPAVADRRQRAIEHRGVPAANSCSRSSSRGTPSDSGCARWCSVSASTIAVFSAPNSRRDTSTSPAATACPACTSASSTRAGHVRGSTPTRDVSAATRQAPPVQRRRSSRPRRAAPPSPRSSAPGSNASRCSALERRRAANRGPRRLRIEDQAAGDRERRRVGAQDVAIAAREDRRRFEPQPHEGARAGRDRRHSAIGGSRPDHRDAAEQLGGALMKSHARAVLERLRRRQHLDDRVGDPRLLERARRDELLPALRSRRRRRRRG